MNKNAILFFGFVVLCVVVVMVINTAINSPDNETVSSRLSNAPKNVGVHQHVSQVQAPAPVEEQESKPEYEATVSNGTILF
jgi:hypothetical protein